MILEGRAWVFGDGISTDLLYPQDAYGLPIAEAAQMVCRANRPEWIELVRPGDIIVGGRNFGIGSARPVAGLLRHLGVVACVAESVTSLFQRNGINFAVPAIACPGILEIVQEGQTIAVDLAAGRVENRDSGASRVSQSLPPLLLDIVSQGGLLASLRDRGLIGGET